LTMSLTKEQLDAAIENCAREPIHTPSLVQPHGYLFACDAKNWIITHVSANAPEFTGKAAKQIFGSTLAAVLGRPVVDALAQAVQSSSDDTCLPGRVFATRIKGQKGLFDASVHIYNGRRIVEVEPVEGAAAGAEPLDLVRSILTKLQQARTLSDLCEQTVHRIRELIGYDRVMIYRFLRDGSGQVIAEARHDDVEAFLHLRYPASDIPQQARDLYKKNWVRVVGDVNARSSAIIAGPDAGALPLDLSFSVLRSVSPVHIEYLKNMRVGASMSISIIVGGELWGLIACHHRTANLVAANVRSAAELLGQVFSLQIQTVEGIEAYVTMRAARALLDRVIAEFPVDGDLMENLASRLGHLGSFIPSDGIGVWLNRDWRSSGVTPGLSEIPGLAAFIDRQRKEETFATHQLASDYAAAGEWNADIAGIMAIPLSRTSGNFLFFFRKEVSQTVEWGGNPEKQIATAEPGRLSPRHSFDLWKQDVRGQSLPWTSRERLIADTLRVYLLDIIVRFRDVILEERRQAELKGRLQASELNHRVKGTLELIQSLVTRGSEDAASVQTFVHALHGRLQAIALAHDATAANSGSDVRHLLETAFASQVPAASQLVLEGPDTRLDAKAYTVLALCVHELVSNAVRHGALSTHNGHLTVRWFADSNGRFLLHWEESGGPSAAAPEKSGVGLSIVKRNIPHALGGEADVRFEKAGIKARFAIPARYVERLANRQPRSQPAVVHTSAHRPLDGFALLVVEDQMLTAMELEETLYARGACSVDLAGTVEKAFDCLVRKPPDAAILDVDLGDDTSFEIAGELNRRSIPFIFAASEAEQSIIPATFRDINVVGKPYSPDQVSDALKEALMPHLIRAVLAKLF
jgi:light-regulated signal transduction histidine kinase (bacteriophytochrome)